MVVECALSLCGVSLVCVLGGKGAVLVGVGHHAPPSDCCHPRDVAYQFVQKLRSSPVGRPWVNVIRYHTMAGDGGRWLVVMHRGSCRSVTMGGWALGGDADSIAHETSRSPKLPDLPGVLTSTTP